VGRRRRVYVAVNIALALVVLVAVPTWPPHLIGSANTTLLSVASLAAIWAIVAVGTGMFVNLSGLPTLAQGGLWGVGAYASGITIIHLDIGFWPSLLFAAAIPALLALPIALVALRTTGVAFLVVTIAFTEFIVLLITNLSITEGPRGLQAAEPPGSIGPLEFESLSSQYYLYLVFLALAIALYAAVARSRFGARLRAIRDRERLARSLGINVLVHQLIAFELSATVVGVAGALLLLQQQVVTPELFGSLQFIGIYLAIVLGGLTVLGGPALGAWIVLFLPLWIGSDDPNMSLLIYGVLLVAAMLVLPRGLLGALKGWTAGAAEPAPAAEPGPGGGDVALPPPVERTAQPLGDVLLEATSVKRWFGANRALDGIDISVRTGEIRGVIGPNGSGKTTLLNCVSGFLATTDGAITYRGEPLQGRRPDSIARLGLVRTFQEPEAFGSFTARESCELIVASARSREAVNEQLPEGADAVLASCGLSAAADLPVTELSYGQLRLLGVAMALSCRPYLLLLDEPAAGLTPTDAVALRDVLLNARAAGVTLVVIDHDMSFLLPICDSVTVLDGGTKLAEGEPDAIARDPAVIAAYLGESFAKRRAGMLAGEKG
jgi:branched-chain amino acid transport system permease protein